MARKKARCGEAEAGQSKGGNERNLSLRGARGDTGIAASLISWASFDHVCGAGM
jgi:hypothetical protein